MRTSTTLEVIACLKTLLLRYKLRVLLLKNPNPRSLELKIQSWLIKKPPLRLALMNQGRSSAKIRRRSILRKSKTEKILLWL